MEIGLASGYLSRCFVETGCCVTGVEVDEALARRAALPGVSVGAWPTLCAVHLIFNIAPQKGGP